MTMIGLNRLLHVRALLLLLLCSFQQTALAGDLALYETPLQGINFTESSLRQPVCERYQLYTTGASELKDALSGMQLRPIITQSRFFHYNDTTGIDPDDPGLVVLILEELGTRANFTWRESFAVSSGPEPNTTWTQMLELYTEMFDISIDYFDKNTERLNKGIAFLDQWFDGNMILIEKVEPLEEDNSISYTNYLKPFTANVWYATLATVIVSAFLYQWLEYINHERDGRSFWQWFEDNLYFSSINFTQQYSYEPASPAGRIFGFSMAVWAMVMGATYTANLASLFVEELGQPTKIQDIDQAISSGHRICTWANTNADMYIAKRYAQANRVPLPSEYDVYQGLHTGKCKVAIGAVSTWQGYENDKAYNTYCDLEWVGKTVEEVSSAFAVKADSSEKCTNLIRDVLNYHLSDMTADRTLERLWNEYYDSNDNTIDCATHEPSDEATNNHTIFVTDNRRLLSSTSDNPQQQQSARQLKGGGSANAAAAAANSGGDGDDESNSLSMRAMAGTFVLHAVLSGLAVLVGTFSWYRKKTKAKAQPDDAFGEETSLTKKPIHGMSLASGTCANGGSQRVNSLLNKNGTVEEQMQALFGAQKELQNSQEHLTQQMALVVSMLSKMQEQDQRSTTTDPTDSSSSTMAPSSIGKLSSLFS